MRVNHKRILALFLSLALVLGLTPLGVLGEAITQAEKPADSISITAASLPDDTMANQTFTVGQAGAEPVLPGTLSATLTTTVWAQVEGTPAEGDTDPTWEATTTPTDIAPGVYWALPAGETFSTNAEKTFVYTASLQGEAAAYPLAGGLALPTITVTVVKGESPTNAPQEISSFVEPNVIEIPLGDTRSEDAITAEFRGFVLATVDGIANTQVPVSWSRVFPAESTEFSTATSGEYFYAPSIDESIYTILSSANLPTQLVRVGDVVHAPTPTSTGDFTVAGGTLGMDYSYESNTLTILTGTALTISGTTTTDTIVVKDGITANLTLDGVNIDMNTIADACAFDIQGTATANITLTGDNTLKSGENKAGLQVQTGATLNLGGTGTLNATGGEGSAGIGGGKGGSGGNITISGGTVMASGKGSAGTDQNNGGAGIGGGAGIDGGAGNGGEGGSGGNITISGGTVTANGGDGSAGIGGGNGGIGGAGSQGGKGGKGGNITISDGTVTATSASSAGIGGGKGGYGGAGSIGGAGGSGGNITIRGGMVTANGYSGAGIGGGAGTSGIHDYTSKEGVIGGSGGSGGNITISGGTVMATSARSAGIGGGSGGDFDISHISSTGGAGGAGGNITLSGGVITATGGGATRAAASASYSEMCSGSGAGIGGGAGGASNTGGAGGAGGNITISGTAEILAATGGNSFITTATGALALSTSGAGAAGIGGGGGASYAYRDDLSVVFPGSSGNGGDGGTINIESAAIIRQALGGGGEMGSGAGIGGGGGGGVNDGINHYGAGGAGGNITISGTAQIITAQGGDEEHSSTATRTSEYGGAGIGSGGSAKGSGGRGSNGGTIKIMGSTTVNAIGGNNATGIGGIGGTIHVLGTATVNAIGGNNATGIGGGRGSTGSAVILSGGTVTATGGQNTIGSAVMQAFSAKPTVSAVENQIAKVTVLAGANAGSASIRGFNEDFVTGLSYAKITTESFVPTILLGTPLVANGTQQTQSVGLVMVDGRTLAEGTDYTLSGNTATDVGAYTLTLTGTGNYSGTQAVPFSMYRTAEEALLYTPAGTVDLRYSAAPNGNTLHIAELSEAQKHEDLAKLREFARQNGITGIIHFLADITMTDANGNEVQPQNGNTRIRISVPGLTPADTVTVLHIKDDGTVERIIPVSVGYNFVDFNPTSLSVYSVIVHKATTTPLSPQTGVYALPDMREG